MGRARYLSWAAPVAAAAVALSGCTPSARTAGPYRAKAVTAAEAVASALQSDRLVVLAVRRGHTTAAYVSVATSQAEDDGSSAASTFLSIQPPNGASDRLRAELADLLDAATSVLGDVRIAGRRGDRSRLVSLDEDLAKAAERLDGFASA
jgi:hypothetical protein